MRDERTKDKGFEVSLQFYCKNFNFNELIKTKMLDTQRQASSEVKGLTLNFPLQRNGR